eukprot:NODE_3266_length_1000_cov_31.076747_g3120_i0.p1 GENE.NODE_3266_length_1000_cov_31.076747_g3120_i0~~NODE_3266_length_1000_cov_31.076747_g3120_i0.p1  ORF type:complete len:303 (-),score=50.54 NODE_3266_length_1000_cov_31.076747_g3120_i0:89-997(-)
MGYPLSCSSVFAFSGKSALHYKLSARTPKLWLLSTNPQLRMVVHVWFEAVFAYLIALLRQHHTLSGNLLSFFLSVATFQLPPDAPQEGVVHWERSPQNIVYFIPPSFSSTLSAHLCWSRLLNKMVGRTMALSSRLYFLTTMGGGWAALRHASNCLVYAAKQYVVASKMGDLVMQCRCRIHLGYYHMWCGRSELAHQILLNEAAVANNLRHPILQNSVHSAMASLHLANIAPSASLTVDSQLLATCHQVCRKLSKVNLTDHTLERCSDSEGESASDTDTEVGVDLGAECVGANLQDVWELLFT